MFEDPRSHGLWALTAPPAPPTSVLAGEARADVVVVGAGYTGLSAALTLAEAGAKVMVLEGAEIGFGGSGRNVGLLNAGLWLAPDEVADALGADYGERLLTLLGDGPSVVRDLVDRHGIDCELERNGTLHCGVGRAGVRDLENRARQWSARGAPVTLLEGAAAAAAIGSAAYPVALLDARAGTIQPLGYVRGLARAAIAAGAQLFTRSPVLAWAQDGAGWRVTTAQGSVRADWVVVATNAYTTAPWPQVREELTHLPYFNLATAPLPPEALASILPGRQGCWDTKQILSSFRLDRAGRLVFGSVGALRGTGTAIHRAWARRSLKRLFPQLGPVSFEAEWYGMIGMTDDSLPRLHRFAPNVLGFSGYNGRGIAPGTVFGRALGDRILGRIGDADMPLPFTDPAPASLRSLHEPFYELGAQAAHVVGARL